MTPAGTKCTAHACEFCHTQANAARNASRCLSMDLYATLGLQQYHLSPIYVSSILAISHVNMSHLRLSVLARASPVPAGPTP